MNDITFKQADLTDTDNLYALSVEFEHYNKENSTRPHEHSSDEWQISFAEDLEQILKNEDSYIYLALVDGESAGYIFARLCKGCYAFIIEELYVRSQFNKLGIGGKLLDFAIAHGRKLDYDIKVEVFDWNQSAKDYYLKKGFFVESLVLKLLGTP